MAKLDPAGAVPWFVAACFRYRPADQTEIARNVYSHLTLDGSRAASARRQAFDRDVRYLNDALRNGLPEEPPAQPRPRTTQADLARAIYSDLVQEREWDAYREKYARWQEDLMRPWGFVRKGK